MSGDCATGNGGAVVPKFFKNFKIKNMKQLKTAWFFLLFNVLAVASALAVDLPVIRLGIFRTATTTLEVRVQSDITINNVIYSDGWFVVKFPTSYGVTSFTMTSPFGYNTTAIIPGPGCTDNTDGGWTYYIGSFSNQSSIDRGTWTGGMGVLAATITIAGTNIPANGDFRLTMDSYAQCITDQSAYYQQLSASGVPPGDYTGPDFYQETTLPIELSKFTAKAQPDQTVALDWETATEINFSHYSIEHSIDGAKFAPIGKVDGRGTQNGAETYGFTHDRPFDGDNHYRLKMVDNDLAFSYSPIRTVRFGDAGSNFKLWPNITPGPFTLFSTDLEKFTDELNYQIFDVAGKLIEEGLIRDEKLDFDFSNFKSGAYVFSVYDNKKKVQQFQLLLTTY